MASLRRVRRRSVKTLSQIEVLADRALLTLDVPEFSSLPGADHTIYLDFDGHTVTGTSWNGYYNQDRLVALAYDLDGNPDEFNATELARIEETFKRVAEDFRPFDINVTTVDPGVEALRKANNSDTQWGVRSIQTRESTMVDDPSEYCGCGGIAYINSFNWNSDTPVWTYNAGSQSMGETVSHEVGHALGLSHDGGGGDGTYYRGHGSGEISWGSLMGASFSPNVTHWDKGEYFEANNGGSNANYGSGPDDLAIISNVSRNGFGYRDDDFGDTDATADPLDADGTDVDTTGIIERTDDVDVFRFVTGEGEVTLNLDPFKVRGNNVGANLDVSVELYDTFGLLVASDSPPDTLSAQIQMELPAGEYFLHVDGVGTYDPSTNPPKGYTEYASLGQYNITGTLVEFGEEPVFSVSDVTVNEGDGTAEISVTLEGDFTGIVSTDYATSDGTATEPGDYSQTSGTLSFSEPGTQTFTVTIVDDSDAEPTETFIATLSSPVNAAIDDGEATVTIEDDDISIEVSDVSLVEGNEQRRRRRRRGGPTPKNFVFEVNLSAPSDQTVTVNYTTVDGTAKLSDSDYRSKSGTVSFSPGETSKTVTVIVLGDNRREGDETFELQFSNWQNAGMEDTVAVGTILEDDTRGRRGGRGGTELVAEDPIWFFEGPNLSDHDHSHHGHDHSHDHHAHGDHDHQEMAQEHEHDCDCEQCRMPTANVVFSPQVNQEEDLFDTEAELTTELHVLDVHSPDLAMNTVSREDRDTSTVVSAPASTSSAPAADSLFSGDLGIDFDTL